MFYSTLSSSSVQFLVYLLGFPRACVLNQTICTKSGQLAILIVCVSRVRVLLVRSCKIRAEAQYKLLNYESQFESYVVVCHQEHLIAAAWWDAIRTINCSKNRNKLKKAIPVLFRSMHLAGSTNILSCAGWQPPHDPPHSPTTDSPSSVFWTLSSRFGSLGVPQASHTTSLRMRIPVPDKSIWNLPLWHLEAAEKQSPARPNLTELPSVLANW